MKFLNNLDLTKNILLNGVLHPLASAPASPNVGQMYYDTTALQPLFWNGSAFTNKATDSALLNGQNAAFYLARGNHTGTQAASTISDLATTVQAYRLDQFTAPNAAVSLNSQRLTNVADPSSAQDAATMGWVQTQVASAAAGIDSKPSVRVVANANITLSGAQTIDGVSVIAGDRVLARGQSTASQNGVYVCAAGAWARAVDADATGEITPGAFWFVEEGTTYGKTQWRSENTGTITLGSTSITINQFGAAASYTASLGVQLVGNDIRAEVIASKGILASPTGLELDTAVAVRKFSANVGNGSLTSIAVTHSLGTKDVTIGVREVSTDAGVLVDWVATDTNTVTLTFAVAPASNAYRVTVHG
jgi:hypothetical protein